MDVAGSSQIKTMPPTPLADSTGVEWGLTAASVHYLRVSSCLRSLRPPLVALTILRPPELSVPRETGRRRPAYVVSTFCSAGTSSCSSPAAIYARFTTTVRE
jgi:hypothetical protein